MRASFSSPKELEKKIKEYYEYCDKFKKPLTIAGLAVFLGVDRNTVYNYQKKGDEYFRIIKKARDKVLASLEERAVTKGNAGVIFILKNYGYTDKQEISYSKEIKPEIVIDDTGV